MTDFDITPILELALDDPAKTPKAINTGRSADDDLLVYVLKDGVNQELRFVDLEDYADRPYSKRGTSTTFDAASFIAAVNRHADPRASTIWANKQAGTVSAVLDDHEQIGDQAEEAKTFTLPRPGWGQHRVELQLTATDDWKLWTGQNGQLMSQVAFAEFIEQGATCISEPDPATFYEVALSLRAHTGVEFKSSYVLESGEMGFRYEETTTASAGKKGELEIPRSFTLSIEPYDGTETYPLLARLMYRTGQAGLSLGYRLIRPADVLTQAFDDLSGEISAETGLTVLNGQPRP